MFKVGDRVRASNRFKEDNRALMRAYTHWNASATVVEILSSTVVRIKFDSGVFSNWHFENLSSDIHAENIKSHMPDWF